MKRYENGLIIHIPRTDRVSLAIDHGTADVPTSGMIQSSTVKSYCNSSKYDIVLSPKKPIKSH